MAARLIDIQQLSIGFRQQGKIQPAVRDISFHIDKGEIIGLVGESGSGKSVTSLAMMQLLPPPPASRIRGRILYQEAGGTTDLLSLSPEAIRQYRGNHLGMIFQEPMSSLNPVYTCGNQLIEAIRVHQAVTGEEAARRAIALFEQVQLPDPAQMMHRYPHQLSGGQKQRVMIAMAVCCQPSLIIADEPTTALDVTVQQAILQLLRQLQRQLQISVLFITHDLGVVAEVADRVLVMYKGQLVEQGTTEQVFSAPRHPYTKGLIACRPPLHRRLRRLPVVGDFMEEKSGRIVEKPTDLAGLLQELEQPPGARQARLAVLSSQQPVLDVQHLVVRFPARKSALGKVHSWTHVVDGVSFALHPGETLGLVGESGCGKTTLSRAVLQLIRPASGQVLYQGTDLCRVGDKNLRRLRKQLQIIFQDPYSSLNPRMTIGQAIMEPMHVHGLYGSDTHRRHKTIELLEKVRLNASHFHRYPHEFSGGQRQRIGIARALAVQPDLIICDESVSALDVSVQAQVLNLLVELKEEFGFSTIFISHDLSVVKFLCDRILVMRQGRIEEAGPAEQIYDHPVSPYTRRLLAAIPRGPEEPGAYT
jgi:peptide/nickel transport system ATP-binding protein